MKFSVVLVVGILFSPIIISLIVLFAIFYLVYSIYSRTLEALENVVVAYAPVEKEKQKNAGKRRINVTDWYRDNTIDNDKLKRKKRGWLGFLSESRRQNKGVKK